MDGVRKRRTRRDLTVRRALAMLAALQEGDAGREDLIAAVIAEVGEQAYGASPSDSFEKDKRFLQSLGFTLEYRKQENRYFLKPNSHPLLRLSLTAEELDMLPVIQQAFASTPYADNAARLVKRIRTYLPPALQLRAATDPLLALFIRSADVTESEAAKMRIIVRALQERRWLEFDYHSPRTERTIRHPVQPYDSLEYRDGHFYFEGRNLRIDKTLDYRVDRIVNGTIRLLPNKFAEAKRSTVVLPLRYRLAEKIARYGASRRFAGHEEEKLSDGSVLVSAQIAKDDLFWASKILLKYGENCTVLEPPALVEEMKRVAKEMAQSYGLAAE